jgi:MFS family permease
VTRLAAILTLGMACATFLGSALSVLSPFIVVDLGVSRTQLGWLFTAIGGTGALGSLVAGPVTDRLGGRRMLDTLFVLVVLGVVGAACAPGFGWLLAAALLAGLPNAAGNPATNKLIAELVPPGRRGVIIGAKQSGVAVSIFLAGAFLPPVAVAAGQRHRSAAATLPHVDRDP